MLLFAMRYLLRQLISVIICNDDDDSIPESAKLIRVPGTVDCLQGLINVIPLQLLSYRKLRRSVLMT